MSRFIALALLCLPLTCYCAVFIDGLYMDFYDDTSSSDQSDTRIEAGADSSGGRCDTFKGVSTDHCSYNTSYGSQAELYDAIGIQLPSGWSLKPAPSNLHQLSSEGYTILRDAAESMGGVHGCTEHGFDRCTDAPIGAKRRSFIIEGTSQPDGEYTHDFRALGMRLPSHTSYIGPKTKNMSFSFVKTYYVLSGRVWFNRPSPQCNVTAMPSYDFGTAAPGASLKSNLPMRVFCNLPARITMSLTPPANGDLTTNDGWVTVTTPDGVTTRTAFEAGGEYTTTRDEGYVASFERKIEVRVDTPGALAGGVFNHAVPLVISYE